MTTSLNKPQNARGDTTLEGIFAKYNNSKMGPKGALRLRKEAIATGQPLKFEDQKEEDEFFLGLTQLARSMSDFFGKFRMALVLPEAEDYNSTDFYQEYRKKTGKAYVWPESRLPMYDMLIEGFLNIFGRIRDRKEKSTPYYNAKAMDYNRPATSISNNIITHIDWDYDSTQDKFLNKDFEGLDENLIREFFITMKQTFPQNLPLIDDSKYNTTVVDKTQSNLKEVLR